jgi:hypothetical protein
VICGSEFDNLVIKDFEESSGRESVGRMIQRTIPQLRKAIKTSFNTSALFVCHCISRNRIETNALKSWIEVEAEMSLGTLLIIIVVILLLGALPTWPYSAQWGYYPSSGLGVIVIILVVLLALGRI